MDPARCLSNLAAVETWGTDPIHPNKEVFGLLAVGEIDWKGPAEEVSPGHPAQQLTHLRTPALAPESATGEELATESIADTPLRGCAVAAGTGGDGGAVRLAAEAPPVEYTAGGEGEEEEQSEASGGTAGAAPTSGPAEPAPKKKKIIISRYR